MAVLCRPIPPQMTFLMFFWPGKFKSTGSWSHKFWQESSSHSFYPIQPSHCQTMKVNKADSEGRVSPMASVCILWSCTPKKEYDSESWNLLYYLPQSYQMASKDTSVRLFMDNNICSHQILVTPFPRVDSHLGLLCLEHRIIVINVKSNEME